MTDNEVINIEGFGKCYKHPTAKYDWANAPSTCPVCGGVGIPWCGWFACDGNEPCGAVALIETGAVYIPLQDESEQDSVTELNHDPSYEEMIALGKTFSGSLDRLAWAIKDLKDTILFSVFKVKK